MSVPSMGTLEGPAPDGFSHSPFTYQFVSLQLLLICPGHSLVTHHHLMGIKMVLIVYNPFDLLPQLRTWKHAIALQARAVVA